MSSFHRYWRNSRFKYTFKSAFLILQQTYTKNTLKGDNLLGFMTASVLIHWQNAWAINAFLLLFRSNGRRKKLQANSEEFCNESLKCLIWIITYCVFSQKIQKLSHVCTPYNKGVCNHKAEDRTMIQHWEGFSCLTYSTDPHLIHFQL